MVKAWLTGAVLAFIAFFVAAPVVTPLVWPLSYYYDLRTISFEDATEGNSPKIRSVDRDIFRDFTGRFEVQLLRLEGAEFQAFWACGQYKSPWRTYRVGASIPKDADLDWWMDIPPNRECHLPPGSYKTITTVCARTIFGSGPCEDTSSPMFTIKPKRKS